MPGGTIHRMNDPSMMGMGMGAMPGMGGMPGAVMPGMNDPSMMGMGMGAMPCLVAEWVECPAELCLE